jgi:DNA-binding PadR family transcriptional regulator
VLSRDTLSVNYGSLYPALHRLEARGWINGTWAPSANNRRARFYALTPAGRRQLGAERETWERFSTALDLILRTS